MAEGPTPTESRTRPALTAAGAVVLAALVCLPSPAAVRLVAALGVLALGAHAVVLARRARALSATLVTQVEARTAALTVSTERMRRLAHTDSLTGLGNRHALLSHLRETGAADVPVAVALLDLDGFKEVNDSLGHAAGDRMLQAVAERLRTLAPDDAVVARLGGDEFALVLRVPADLERAEAMALGTAEELLAGLAVPLTRDGRESNVAASMGLAVRRPGDTADHLMRNADVAMYAAKDRGRRRAVLYEPEMRTGMLRRLALETDLRAALTAGDVAVAFQPVVELDGRRLLGFEALARWRRPDGTVVPPSEFVPLAEECGLMRELGRTMLFAACNQAVTWWGRDGGPAPWVAVNISAEQLTDGLLEHDVLAALATSGLTADRLVLELTESSLVRPEPGLIASLERLRRNGVRVALDDFGVGYAALGALLQLPVDRLKIDRSFVMGVNRGPKEASLAGAVVALAAGLGLDVVAEGVETSAQASALRAMGCTAAQGFLYSPAVPPAEVFALLHPAAVPLARPTGRRRPLGVPPQGPRRQTPATPSRT